MAAPPEAAPPGAPSADLLERARGVRMLVMDIDGTLTDGAIVIGADGELAKSFSVRDGFGLTLLARLGIELAIITGRSSPIVAQRARELGIRHVIQAAGDKRAVLQRLCAETGIGLAQTAFIGDDWPDLGAMAACGLSAAPADAVEEVRAAACWVAGARAGHGAVRELAMLLIDARGQRAALLAVHQPLQQPHGPAVSASPP